MTKKGPIQSALFYEDLNKCLPGKSARQSLTSSYRRQPFYPCSAPVCCAMTGFGVPCTAASCVALVFSRLFEGIGIAATAALHAIELFARGELLALVATSQMAVDVEVDNHELSPSVTCTGYDNFHMAPFGSWNCRQKNTRMRAGDNQQANSPHGASPVRISIQRKSTSSAISAANLSLRLRSQLYSAWTGCRKAASTPSSMMMKMIISGMLSCENMVGTPVVTMSETAG